MGNDLINKFDVLDINAKRDQICNELITIHELIINFEKIRGITPITKVKNYDINKNKDLIESEMLTFLYEDIYNIQQELITLLSCVEKDL